MSFLAGGLSLLAGAAGFLAVPGVSFLTYLWHYTVARLLYEDLVRPLGVAAVGLALLAAALLIMHTRRRRR